MTATTPAPSAMTLTLTGRVIEVGNLDGGNVPGFVIDRGDLTYATITGLTEDEARIVAWRYDKPVTISVGAPVAAAPADDLRKSVQQMTGLLKDREWADLMMTDPDAIALWDAIDALVTVNNDAVAALQQRQAPAQAEDPVVEANRQLLLDRSRVGMAKYGTTLAGAGLSRGQLLQHALEESLDLSNYLQTLIQAEAAPVAKDDDTVIARLPDILAKLQEAYSAGTVAGSTGGGDESQAVAVRIMREWDLPDAEPVASAEPVAKGKPREIRNAAGELVGIARASCAPQAVAQAAPAPAYVGKLRATLYAIANTLDDGELRAAANAAYELPCETAPAPTAEPVATDEQLEKCPPPFAAPASRVHFDDATIEAAALKHVATDYHRIEHLIPNYRCTEQFARLKAFAEELASGFREGRNTQPESSDLASPSPHPVSIGAEADKLHAAIMNLPCTKEPNVPMPSYWYKRGHRDARHAAAKLVNEFSSRAEGGAAEASTLHTWPAEIYLSTGEDDELLPFDSYHEVSWCDHPTNSVDVRYVRADLAATPPTQQETDK